MVVVPSEIFVEVLGTTALEVATDEVGVSDGLGDGDGTTALEVATDEVGVSDGLGEGEGDGGSVGISNVSPSLTLRSEYGPHRDSPSRLMVLALTRRR